MTNSPKKASLRLVASTRLAPDSCLDLIRRTAGETKPGASYAGQGLRLDVVPVDATTLAISIDDGSRELCTFSADASRADASTRIRIGGLQEFVLLNHSVFFVPVGKEIAGFGYYKRFLAAVERALRAADSDASTAVSVPDS